MTREEIHRLIHQVLEAKERLAHVERDYNVLHGRLMQEIGDKYPLQTKEASR